VSDDLVALDVLMEGLNGEELVLGLLIFYLVVGDSPQRHCQILFKVPAIIVYDVKTVGSWPTVHVTELLVEVLVGLKNAQILEQFILLVIILGDILFEGLSSLCLIILVKRGLLGGVANLLGAGVDNKGLCDYGRGLIC
jgi:hypothetical protein